MFEHHSFFCNQYLFMLSLLASGNGSLFPSLLVKGSQYRRLERLFVCCAFHSTTAFVGVGVQIHDQFAQWCASSIRCSLTIRQSRQNWAGIAGDYLCVERFVTIVYCTRVKRAHRFVFRSLLGFNLWKVWTTWIWFLYRV